jgi:HEAT repeat protein
MRVGVAMSLITGLALANPVPQPLKPPTPGQPTTINIQGATIRAGGTITVNGQVLGPGQSFVQPANPATATTPAAAAAAAAKAAADAERASHEAEHETVAKCVADMKNPNSEVRLRAILILGKYRNYQAVLAVQSALKDKDDAVRSAALVALTEGTSFSSANTPLVLAMLDDGDVHIRRIASSFLRQAMLYYRMPTSASLQTPAQKALVAESKARVIGAFSDADATVRRNMMSSIRYFASFGLPASVVSKGLRDEDREVRILALQALGQFSSNTLVQDVMVLVDDPDQKIRFHVAEMLANLPAQPSVTEMLKKLAKDKDFEVSTSAMMGLFQNDDKNVEYASVLRKRVDDSRVTQTTANSFIRMIAYNQGNEHQQMLKGLLAHQKASYRQIALDSYARARMQAPPVMALLTGAQDSTESVRSTALRYLGQAPLPSSAVARLGMSEHADVRRFVATYCASLDLKTRAPRFSNDAIEPILMELLLDDDNPVRGTAIRTIVSRQLPDWEFIAEETLMSDDDYSIQQQVVSLLRSRPSSHSMLQRALKSPTLNPNLRNYINSILRPPAPRPTVPFRPTIVRPPITPNVPTPPARSTIPR